MFLSKLVLNARGRDARRDLASPYEMHRTILSAGFDGVPKEDIGRVLFRVDEDRTGREPPFVLIQSERQPEWSKLPRDYAAQQPECKQYDPQFRTGQRLRFRLRANPTKRLREKSISIDGKPVEKWHNEKGEGKRVGLFKETDQTRWIVQKSSECGFRIPGRWETVDGQEVPNFSMDVIPEGRVWNGKKSGDGWFLSVRFEGLLEVTDPATFRAAVCAGIGPAKGFGFGLLSLAPA